jgi:hypothetical protein
MTKHYMLIATAAAACSLGGCASQIGSEARDRSNLERPAVETRTANASAAAEALGETASAYGDDQTAVKLYERSYGERPTLLNEFNLAGSYARTGRPLEAITFYRMVADDHSRVQATTESPIRRNGVETAFNLSEEAERRLIALEHLEFEGKPDAGPMTYSQAAHVDARSAGQTDVAELAALAGGATTQ